MFDVSRAEFHRVIFPPDKDLHWLENEINLKRFNWKNAHDGEDVGEEECRKAVIFAIAGAKGLEDASKRLQLEMQNNPTMSAHSAIQFVSLFMQSKKTSDKLHSEARAFASQTSASNASHILAIADGTEVNMISSLHDAQDSAIDTASSKHDLQ